jgi:hypothetical protein
LSPPLPIPFVFFSSLGASFFFSSIALSLSNLACLTKSPSNSFSSSITSPPVITSSFIYVFFVSTLALPMLPPF